MDFIGKILLSLIFLNNREKILQRQVNRNGESNKQGNNKVYLSSSHKLIHPQPLAFKANLHNAQAIFSMQTNPITKTALTLHWHMSPPPTRPRNCREIIGSCSQICTIPLVIRIRRISYSEDSLFNTPSTNTPSEASYSLLFSTSTSSHSYKYHNCNCKHNK